MRAGSFWGSDGGQHWVHDDVSDVESESAPDWKWSVVEKENVVGVVEECTVVVRVNDGGGIGDEGAEETENGEGVEVV